MALRWRMPAVAVLVFAMTLAYTTGESETEDYAMEAFSPKIAQKDGAMDEMMAFIQEDQFSEKEATCNCQPAVTKAYGKFRGDMKKIEALKEQCDTRANKAETESQKQAGISRRCLAAEGMLSADEKTKSKKMREAISKETSVEAAQYSEKAKDLAKQCTEKIALARKDEAAKSGAGQDAAVKKEQMRMKGEIEKFAAEKAEFKLKAKRMQMKLKVELSNVEKKVQAAQGKQLEAETALKKAQREIKDGKAKLKRQAVLAEQKLAAVKAQLDAKSKECSSASKAVDTARAEAKKASEGTTHAQLAAKAAETAEKVQVVKLKNNLDKENQKEKAVEGALQKDKSKLAQERVELNAALRKDQRLQGKDGADKARIAADKDKFKDMSAKAQADRARAREEEKKLGEKGSKTKEELAAAKANGVAQQAKDAIAEGQTKGQLTVVLGKLKANEATIAELRKEITELKTSKEGGAGLKLKARLVELKVKELAKEKDGYKARLVAKGKICDKESAESKTEIKVCMARSIGYQKQIAACIGAEKALKREELSVQALGKLSKEKITRRLRMRRKQLAVCKAKSDGLERHLQDKMVMKTKLESTERVLTEWKKTGKALQTQVHRLTMQRNAELLKQQRLSMQISAAHKQLAEAGIKVNGLTNEQKALLAKKNALSQAEDAIKEKDKVVIAKEDQHLQVCRLKVRKLIGSLRVCALKKGALKVAYQTGEGKAARQLSRVDVRLRKCEAKSQLKLDPCRKKQHAAEALAGSARARLQACTSFRVKTTTLMGHMAKAEATFQKCRKMLKIDEAKLSKTMQINSGLTTALADKQRKEKLASAKASSLAKGLKICEHVAKKIEGKYKGQLQKRNTAYNSLLKTWNTYKNKNKGLKICEKIAASQRVAASVCEAKLVGTKKELAACMGAENMLKQEGASLAQLKKMSHDKMVKQVQIHRKEVAVCRVRLAGLNAHLVECARCKAQMTHIKTKFQGVAGYLKANANKWQKKDKLANLEEKKEAAQARAMARGLSRAERQIARRDGQIKALEDKNKILETSVQEKAKLMREYKGAMRSKLRKIKKVLWTKAQGSNKKWLRESLKKCHATEVDIHNKWVSGSQKGKMNLELCRRAGKVALKMEQNKCARVKTRAALAERSSNVALSMCKRSSKRLDIRAALAARASKVAIDMCSKKKDEYKVAAESCAKP